MFITSLQLSQHTPVLVVEIDCIEPGGAEHPQVSTLRYRFDHVLELSIHIRGIVQVEPPLRVAVMCNFKQAVIARDRECCPRPHRCVGDRRCLERASRCTVPAGASLTRTCE